MWEKVNSWIRSKFPSPSSSGIFQTGFILLFIAGFTFLDSLLFHSHSNWLSWIPFLLAVLLAILFTHKVHKLGSELVRKNELLERNSHELEETVTRRTAELSEAKQVLEQKLTEIRTLQSSLQKQAMRDPLTDLYNRRFLEEMLIKEFARAKRKVYPISLVMFDIDHFKKLNDTYGHTAGDIVLENLGKIFMTQIRMDDYAIRYGGEEFLLILPQIPYGIALVRANQIREAVKQLVIDYDGAKIQFTISGGVSGYPEHGQTPEELIARADQALYQAKQKGRNRVELYWNEDPVSTSFEV